MSSHLSCGSLHHNDFRKPCIISVPCHNYLLLCVTILPSPNEVIYACCVAKQEMRTFTVVLQGTCHRGRCDAFGFFHVLTKPSLKFSLESFHCALCTTSSSAQSQGIVVETARKKMGHYSHTSSLCLPS